MGRVQLTLTHLLQEFDEDGAGSWLLALPSHSPPQSPLLVPPRGSRTARAGPDVWGNISLCKSTRGRHEETVVI